MSIRWKASGPYFGLGSDRTEEFLKKSYPCIWASLSLFTTLENEVKHYFQLFWHVSSSRSLESIKSQDEIVETLEFGCWGFSALLKDEIVGILEFGGWGFLMALEQMPTVAANRSEIKEYLTNLCETLIFIFASSNKITQSSNFISIKIMGTDTF